VGAASFSDGWLVEWRSGSKRRVVLHSATGKAISTEMALPVDGDLFDSQNYDGLHFLKWKNGKPAELIIVPASVEWSSARLTLILDTNGFWPPIKPIIPSDSRRFILRKIPDPIAIAWEA